MYDKIFVISNIKYCHATCKVRKRYNKKSFFIRYHQQVPQTAPALELQATYGLASPQDFTPPGLGSMWTKKSYEGFKVEKHVPDPVS